MVKYIIVMTALMLIVACSPRETQSKVVTIELGFSAQTSYLQQAQYSLTAIYLVSTANEKVLLSDQTFHMGYLSGQKAPSLLLTADVPVGEYSGLYLVADLSDSVFRTLYEGNLETLTLIDSLNRSIPQAHQLYPLEIAFTEGSFIADQGRTNRLHLLFDGDKSVQPLYQFEDKSGIKALFKPFFLVETVDEQTFESAYSFVSTNYKTIIMASLVTDTIKTVDTATITQRILNGGNVEEAVLFDHLKQQSASIIRWAPKSTGDRLHVQYADELFMAAVLLKDADKGYRLSGYFLQPEQSRPVFNEHFMPLTQSVVVNAPPDQPQRVQLGSLLPGQKVDAGKLDNIWTMTLEDGLMVGVVKSVNPLIIEPVVYNAIKLEPDTELKVTGENLPFVSVGAIVEMKGSKAGEAFFASQITLLDTRKISMRIRLPASSGTAMVMDTEDKHTWLLTSDLSDYGQVDVELGQTGLRIPYVVNRLLLHDARFSIYTDRILDANRQATFSSSDDFFQTLATQLEAGHHINEIHIKGIMQGTDLKAHEINFVCYGTSLFDLVNTEEIVEKGGNAVVQEESDTQPGLMPSSSSGLDRNTILGLSVGLGLPAIGGLAYFIFRLASNALRSEFGQPMRDQTGQSLDKTSTDTSVSSDDMTVTPVSKSNLANYNVSSRNQVNAVVSPEPELAVNNASAQSTFVPTIDYLLEEYPLLQDHYLGDLEDNITADDLKPLLIRRSKGANEDPVDYEKRAYPYVEAELLLKYLHRYSAQATTPQLYQANSRDLLFDENYLLLKDAQNVLLNAFIFSEDNAFQDLGGGASDIGENFQNFITGFIESDDERYAILPVGDTTHFTSAVFIKGANGQLARAVYIDPLYNKSTEPFTKLSELFSTINPDVPLEPYFPEIQKDYCSCGPISMVVATDLVTTLENKRLANESGFIEEAVNVDIDAILQQTKGRYQSVPGHEDIRIKFLKTLDSTNRMNFDRQRAGIEGHRRR